MQTEQLLQYINDLAGVSGCFVASSTGEVLGAALPAIFDETMVNATIKNGSNVLETFRAELPECDEVHFDMSVAGVYLRALEGATLFVILESSDDLAATRIAANVGAKRYQPAVASTKSMPAENSPPLQTKRSAFGFGQRSEASSPAAEAPKKKRGIWG